VALDVKDAVLAFADAGPGLQLVGDGRPVLDGTLVVSVDVVDQP
jgi:hypothetical protein